MKTACLSLMLVLLVMPLAKRADAQSQVPVQPQQTVTPQNNQSSQSQSGQDVFSYSYLQVNRLSEWSDYFNDRSKGNGIKFSYGFDGGVYLFGQWNRLDFQTLDGRHDLSGIGIGAHQEYSDSTSFFIDLEFLRDRLSGSLGGTADNYWRVTYGFHTHMTEYLAFTGAIFTERNTDFGRRPFGERLGLSIGNNTLALGIFGEHTANGNRAEAALTWYYK
ncbi:MAG: hypothetical protein KGL13_09650 [Gammaproteobacteria bacterium]|nr:hypothetical protein [Gammaproteobacteria bacterium]MDE2346717.1 hypothetical protein [Gammaproteobacteria bacterium]